MEKIKMITNGMWNLTKWVANFSLPVFNLMILNIFLWRLNEFTRGMADGTLLAVQTTLTAILSIIWFKAYQTALFKPKCWKYGWRRTLITTYLIYFGIITIDLWSGLCAYQPCHINEYMFVLVTTLPIACFLVLVPASVYSAEKIKRDKDLAFLEKEIAGWTREQVK